MTLNPAFVQAVKEFEGFEPIAQWDYKQWTNGYGTKAHHPHEVITKATAELRLMIELEAAQASVDYFKAGLPDGLRLALTDLTFNAGAGWMHAGLGQAVTSGESLEEVKTILLEYDKAGGRVNFGLEERRKTEVSWIV